MKIYPLSEGSFTVDTTRQFIPFDAGKDVLSERPKGSLLVEVQPFVVVTSKDILVLDTGLGFCLPDGTLQIHNHLIHHGINPLDVTKVLLTHLHKDHAGGISKEDQFLHKRYLSFPNAQYVVHKQEFEQAAATSSRSYKQEDVMALKNSEQLLFVEGEGDLPGGIHYQWTGAHSPWHQVFWIEEEGEKVFFGGDVAPQFMQLKNKFVTKYDADGKKAASLRSKWWQEGREQNWTFLFYHDIKTPVFRFA
jgi:glyoxylase-like metal-dependent hydrolase (beta-lactamase superfamily II)